MAPAHATSTSANSGSFTRTGIPTDLILNWQCSRPHGAKAPVRRPMTACEPCRAAKIKCNGRRECERCRTRNLQCTYTGSTTASRSQRGSHQSPRPKSSDKSTPSQSVTSVARDQLPMDDFEANTIPMTSVESMGQEYALPLSMDTQNMSNDFDWAMADSSGIDMGLSFDFLDHAIPTDLNHFKSMVNTNYGPAIPDSAFALPIDSDSSSKSSQASSSPSPATIPFSACQCRASLMQHHPKIISTMQHVPQPRLNEVLKVTRDVIRSCQDILNCAYCQISCPDLTCIMVVFQQTDACFSHLAKGDANETVKVSVGDYEVSLPNDDTLRPMLVMDLVEQAKAVLTSLTTLGETLLTTNTCASRLSQANLNYLRELTAGFEETLSSVKKSFDTYSSMNGL